MPRGAGGGAAVAVRTRAGTPHDLEAYDKMQDNVKRLEAAVKVAYRKFKIARLKVGGDRGGVCLHEYGLVLGELRRARSLLGWRDEDGSDAGSGNDWSESDNDSVSSTSSGVASLVDGESGGGDQHVADDSGVIVVTDRDDSAVADTGKRVIKRERGGDEEGVESGDDMMEDTEEGGGGSRPKNDRKRAKRQASSSAKHTCSSSPSRFAKLAQVCSRTWPRIRPAAALDCA